MGHITLNQGLRRIEVSNLEIENDLAVPRQHSIDTLAA
jgi:hypothetical protein